jgi:type 1 glutamine amidotransferase
MPRPPLVLVAFLAAVSALVPAGRSQDPVAPERIPVLLIGGANNHDWEWTTPSLQQILEETGRFAVTVTRSPAEALADAEQLQRFRAFVLDYNGERWGEPAESNFLAAVRGGVGVTVIHAANNAFPGWAEYEEMVALLWREGTGHGQFHPFAVEIVDDAHPVTAGMRDLHLHPDELYHRLANPQDTAYRVLATAFSEPKTGGTGTDEPMILVKSFGAGRIFHTPLGHVWRNVPASRASHRDPQFRRLVARGTEWAATGSVSLSPTPPNWISPEERALGFELLFDGRSQEGWRGFRQDGFPAQGWVVDRGCLRHVPNGGGGDLVTERVFGDFELRFEFAVQKRANSGVIYRVSEEERASYMTGPEFQVLDDAGHELADDANTATAALYALVGPEGKQLRATGTFNEAAIIVRGWHVEHWLNGAKVVDVDLDSAEMRARIAASKFKDWSRFARVERGHIALQDHGDEVFYRSIRVRELAGER